MYYAHVYTPTRSSGRMEGARSAGGASSTIEEPVTDQLVRQNSELKRKLEEEASSYKRRLETYKQAQQHQAALVSRLQAKVLQYKQRCSDLEGQMEEVMDTRPVVAPPGSALEVAQQHLKELREERVHDIETALRLLEEEKKKSEKILQVNSILRQQLDDAHESNEALTLDLQKLSSDWEAMREEMLIKEDEWKEEEQYFNDYYTNEHSRLLALWRDVVNIKRLFTEVQSSTMRDLTKMKTDLSLAAKDMAETCSGVQSRQAFSSLVGEETKQAHLLEVSQLKESLAQLKSENEIFIIQLRSKDERIASITKEIHTLEERCVSAEGGIAKVEKLQSELETLQNALRDIAHAVLQDAESRDPEGSSHIHLTPLQPLPRSPKRGPQRTPVSSAFVESTISAVQASLHKYQLQIHELQVKLTTSKENLSAAKKQCDVAEEAQRALEYKLSEATSQLDSGKSLTSQLLQEKEHLQKSLESAKSEKNALDKNRLELSAMLDSVNSDLEKANKLTNKLQKTIDNLEEEKHFLQNEVDRLSKDGELSPFPHLLPFTPSSCFLAYQALLQPTTGNIPPSHLQEVNLRAEEDRSSRLKEELLFTKEELSKLYLAKDLLEQQKSEADSLLSQVDKSRSEIEMELEQVLMEKSDMHESLAKAENLAANLESDKKKLQEDIRKLEEEKASLQSQVIDQSNDLASLRKEILQGEQSRLDLDSEKISYQEKCKFLEVEKEKVELELAQLSRDRSDLSNQLSVMRRKREGLAEELSRFKQRLEQATETISRINRNLEDLVKDCENKQVIIEGNEKEIQRLQEQIASMRADKESLEATLFDAQTNLETLDSKRIQLEKEQQELLINQEALKGEISRLKVEMDNRDKMSQEAKAKLLQESSAMEGEFKQAIVNLKKKNEEIIAKLTEEKEAVRSSLEQKLATSLASMGCEKDNEIMMLQERIGALQEQIENVCQQHEEVLLRAESDKQQSLLLAQQDHQAVLEKLEEARRDLENERALGLRNKREASVKSEQDRATINMLRENLNTLNSKLEQLRVKCEDDRALLENRLQDLAKERDAEIHHSEDIKLQLHLSEDKVDNLRAQLSETSHRLKEVESNRDNLLKELADIRRQLADASFEREKYSNSNKELREHVKRAEGQKREQTRALEEALQKISALEDNRRSLEIERGRLQGLMREMDKELMETKHQGSGATEELTKTKDLLNLKLSEEKQLQARINALSEEKDRAQQQIHQLGKQIMELENAVELTREEVMKTRGKGEDDERRWREREEELLMRLEDTRAGERKLQDQSHNLEVCLADATQQIQELKARLGGSEGRVRALETQLCNLEGAKREVEQKLSSVGSTLRRIAGIQMDGSLNLPYRLLSPTRRWSPVRAPQELSESGRGDVLLDVDPDAVRKGVRSLMHQVAHIERERDDLKALVSDLKKQMKEQTEEQSKLEHKLTSTVASLRQLQEEKGSLEARLGQKSAVVNNLNEVISQKTEESQHLQEKVTTLELALQSGNTEKSQCEERVEKMRQALVRCEADKRAVQEELSRVEGRATKLELQRLAMEGDIQRLQLILQEKESTIQKLQERIELESGSVNELEERCGSLKATVDQLNQSLERANLTERELHQEIQSLQKTLGDTSMTSQSNAEKLKSLQKALYNAENEKRVVVEQLESAQHSLSDLKRHYHNLKESYSKLQSELDTAKFEKSSLEAQLRMANTWPSSESEDLKQQTSELTVKVESLQDKVKQLESEKRSLERKLHSARSKSYEREKGSREWEGSDYYPTPGGGSVLLLEQENRELKAHILKLESELADKEAQLANLRKHDRSRDRSRDIEKYRAAQLGAESLLEAREQSHRQQVKRLENQIEYLREQLNNELRKRHLYLSKSARQSKEVQQLHHMLGNSLRNVSEDPMLDANRLESEARKLDSTLALPLSRN